MHQANDVPRHKTSLFIRIAPVVESVIVVEILRVVIVMIVGSTPHPIRRTSRPTHFAPESSPLESGSSSVNSNEEQGNFIGKIVRGCNRCESFATVSMATVKHGHYYVTQCTLQSFRCQWER